MSSVQLKTTPASTGFEVAVKLPRRELPSPLRLRLPLLPLFVRASMSSVQLKTTPASTGFEVAVKLPRRELPALISVINFSLQGTENTPVRNQWGWQASILLDTILLISWMAFPTVTFSGVVVVAISITAFHNVFSACLTRFGCLFPNSSQT